MKTVEVFGTVVAETEMSVLFDVGGKEDLWIPKSVIYDEDDSDGYGMEFNEGQSTEWNIAEWWALKNDLI